jgi:hypothetical protein
LALFYVFKEGFFHFNLLFFLLSLVLLELDFFIKSKNALVDGESLRLVIRNVNHFYARVPDKGFLKFDICGPCGSDQALCLKVNKEPQCIKELWRMLGFCLPCYHSIASGEFIPGGIELGLFRELILLLEPLLKVVSLVELLARLIRCEEVPLLLLL